MPYNIIEFLVINCEYIEKTKPTENEYVQI